MRIAICGGRLIDPARSADEKKDLFLAEGRIVAAGAAPLGFSPDRTIDAAGLMVAPGLVDVGARLAPPGKPARGVRDFLRKAVEGGITSVAILPDVFSPLDNPDAILALAEEARHASLASLFCLGAFTQGLEGKRISDFVRLREAGAAGFSQASLPLASDAVLLAGARYAATFGYRLFWEPLGASMAPHGVAHEGKLAARLGLSGIPAVAEAAEAARMLLLARETGARLHLLGVSAKSTLDVLEAFAGPVASAGVDIHHLFASEEDALDFDTRFRLILPLRREEDRKALQAWDFPVVSSGHTEVLPEEKDAPFAEAAPGDAGFAYLLPGILAWAEEKKVPLARALARVTSNPGALLGIETRLDAGARADVVIFDPHCRFQAPPEAGVLAGKRLLGKVVMTLAGGRVAHEASP